jgi:hypothetical protein
MSEPKRKQPSVDQLLARIEALEKAQKSQHLDIGDLAKAVVELETTHNSGWWHRLRRLVNA